MWTLSLAIVVLMTMAGFWAGRVAILPPDDPLSSSAEPVTYEVVEQTIGRSLQFTAVAEWKSSPLGRAQIPGIVTSIGFEPGASVEPGEVLFTVDLRPVVVAEGAIPAFREMQSGDEGSDISQLQTLLVALGFLDEEPNGRFSPTTAAAVRAWQAALGVVDDGVVRRGDIVFAPELPARVVAAEALTVGALLIGGEVVVNVLRPAPTIVVPLTPEQRDLVPLAGDVVATYPDGTWPGVIARAARPSAPRTPAGPTSTTVRARSMADGVPSPASLSLAHDAVCPNGSQATSRSSVVRSSPAPVGRRSAGGTKRRWIWTPMAAAYRSSVECCGSTSPDSKRETKACEVAIRRATSA